MADISLGSVVGVPVVVPSITPAVAYTPVFTGLGTGTYTTAAYTWTVGSRRYVVATLTMTAAGSGGAPIAMSLPTNSVINSAALPTGAFGNYTRDTIGWMTAYNTASSGVNASDRLASAYAASSTTVGFVKPSTSSAQTGSDWSNSAQIGIEFNYADSSLAGQDTVAYGAGLATSVKSGLVSATSPQTNIASLITCPQAGFLVSRAQAIAYSDSAGNWRMRFNITYAFTSATLAASALLTMSVSGTVFKVGAGSQAGSGFFNGNSQGARVYMDENTGNISHSYGPSITTGGGSVSGDVELNAKPSWA